MDSQLSSGMVVAGRYTLERCINTAGIGSVWRACDEQTGRTCALRLAEGTGHNLFELAARYSAEVEINERIRCENVVDILDHGEWNGMPYLVIEHVDGEDLASCLRREIFLQPKIAYRLLAQTARALARAHAVGIIHGDLTPENVLIASDGAQPVAKLFNFGLTQKTPEMGVANVTRIGSFLRLPFYASPEQAGGKSIDWRSDLWSLGVLGYECLTGRKPFDSNVFGDLLALIVYEPVPELKLPGIDTPPALEAWWKTASTRDPVRRFQSAKEMSEALGQAFDFPLVFVPEVSSGTVEKKPSSPAIPAARRVGSEESPIGFASRPPQKEMRHSTVIGLGDEVRNAVFAASASQSAAANAPLSPSAPPAAVAPSVAPRAVPRPSAPTATGASSTAPKAGPKPSAPAAAVAPSSVPSPMALEAGVAPPDVAKAVPSPSAPEVAAAPSAVAKAVSSPSAPEVAVAPSAVAKAVSSPSAPEVAPAAFEEEDFGTFQADEAPTTLMQDSVLIGWVDEDSESDSLVASIRRTKILRVAVAVLATGLLVFVALVVHRQVLASRAKRAIPTTADSRETSNLKQAPTVEAIPAAAAMPITEDAGAVVHIESGPATSATASAEVPAEVPVAETAIANVKTSEPRANAQRSAHDANATHAKADVKTSEPRANAQRSAHDANATQTKAETARKSKPAAASDSKPPQQPETPNIVPKPTKPKAAEAHDYGI